VLASCYDAGLYLLIGVGLHLIQVWWSLSYRDSSLLGGAGRGELDSREGAIAVWEDGLAALELALGKVHVEHDSSCV
jgi:hypothetical protein